MLLLLLLLMFFVLSNIQSLFYVHPKMTTFVHRSMVKSIFNIIPTLNNHHLEFWWYITSEHPLEALLVL